MFAYRLARDLGEADPHLMLAKMSENTFRHWMAYYAIEAEAWQKNGI